MTNVPYSNNDITAVRGKSSAIRARGRFIYFAALSGARLMLTRGAARHYNAANSRNSDNKLVQTAMSSAFRKILEGGNFL